MTTARVEGITFSGTELVGSVQGHPTEALILAHKIATLLFEPSRYAWRFYSIEYKPPDEQHLDSAGFIMFRARVK